MPLIDRSTPVRAMQKEEEEEEGEKIIIDMLSDDEMSLITSRPSNSHTCVNVRIVPARAQEKNGSNK